MGEQYEMVTFTADVSHETLSLTTLGELQAGSAVNLEPSLRAGDPLGGHLVSRHVDGVASVTGVARDGDSLRVTFAAPETLARYIARKGSVTIDGVSLTVNDVDASTFGVNLIPHTQAVTTLGRLTAGARVNPRDRPGRALRRATPSAVAPLSTQQHEARKSAHQQGPRARLSNSDC